MLRDWKLKYCYELVFLKKSTPFSSSVVRGSRSRYPSNNRYAWHPDLDFLMLSSTPNQEKPEFFGRKGQF